METKFTPGVWKVRSFSTGSVGTENKMVAIVYGDDPDCESDARQRANARLVSAAPELLATLQNLLGVLENVSLESGVCCCGDNIKNHPNPMDCGHSEVDSGVYYGQIAIADAKKAIAKAKGE